MKTNGSARRDIITFHIIGYSVVTFFAILCLLPFLLTLSGSFTEESSLFEDGYRLIPKVFSTDSYALIFKSPQVIIGAYGITISLVILGTALGLFLTTMTSYVLHRKDFKYRNKFAFYFFFTTLFSGGIVPWYIIMTNLGMKDNYLAMLLPNLLSVFNIIIMRTFFASIPDNIGESAKIDGAGDFTIYSRLYLPMSIPALATIGLFLAIAYWNDWYPAMLFITKADMIPLQYQLYKVFNDMQFAQQVASQTGRSVGNMPSETFKMAMTIVTIGPIIILYPFLQKYFIKGMTVGAVKG